MAKQLNQEAKINLTFSANASQAKSQIIELQGLLNKIALGIDLKINPQQAKEAATAAKELAMHLNNAYNATTGNFDLSKLSRSLNSAKTDITQLSQKLLDAGTTGQQAFVKLAQTVAAADRPMITVNARLKEMWVTMKNTAKWQLSSSVLHGFMGALQSAYGYAQDLNKSLNNIRIVTGQSVDQMARFAEQANKAAKALSTTTTEYTDAALIYYQQGLNDKEVAERTEATVKLANVSGQTAEQVSDQLTAVWNNFDNGTKSLEYYVDVMAALGAATASSTEEISQGLEKFAAVAETVGLSYEYATAALATVTATTRQSADVVGTAFKTLFARIQDLELGETLEDGVSLGKYSAALKAIGVDVLDVNGNVRQMNDILDDMGEKWNTISKAQQVSIAQTVAGTRQYTQLVALMDNWSYFQENLGVAAGSEGELTRQAEIYEESWAAAQKRVKASAEQIYSDLLDDEFFIDLTDGFSGLLDSVDAFIDGIGGVGPLIGGISSILIGAFSGKVVESLNNFKDNLLITFKGAQKQADSLADSMNKTVVAQLEKSDRAAEGSADKLSDSMRQSLEGTLSLNKAKAALATVQDKLTASEAQGAEIEMNMIKQYEQEAQAIAQTITQLKDKNQLLMSQGSLFSNNPETEKMDSGYLVKHGKAAADRMHASLEYGDSAVQGLLEALMAIDNKTDQVQININELYGDFSKAGQTFKNIFTARVSADDTNSAPFLEWKQQALDFVSVIEQAGGTAIPSLEKAINKIKGSKSAGAMAAGFEDLLKVLNSTKAKTLDVEAVLKRLSKMKGPGAEVAKNLQASRVKTDDLTQANNKLNKAVEDFKPTHTITGLERIVSAAAGLGQVVMTAQSLRSIFQAWNNDDLSFGEKLTTTFMSLSMVVPSALGAVKSFSTALGGARTQIMASLLTQDLYTKAIKDDTLAKLVNTAVSEKATKKDKDAAVVALKNYLIKEAQVDEEYAEVIALGILNTAKAKENVVDGAGNVIKTKNLWTTIQTTAAKWRDVAATIAQKLAEKGLVGVVIAAVAAVAALTVAIIASVNAKKRLNEETKTAAAAMQSLTERYEEATQKVEDFKSAISEYDDGINAIRELTEGTTEYVNAIEEANAKTLKLIETYGMFNDWSYGKDGLITLDPDAIQRMQVQLDESANEAQMDYYVGKANSEALAIESARRTLVDSGATAYTDIDAIQAGGQGQSYLSTTDINTIADIISSKEMEGKSQEQIIAAIRAEGGSIAKAAYVINANFDDWQKYSKTRDSKNEAINYYNQKLLESSFAAAGRYGGDKDLQAMAANLYTVSGETERLTNDLDNFSTVFNSSNNIVSDSRGRIRRRFIRNYYEEQGEDLRGGMGDRQLAELYAEKVLGLEKGSYDYKKGKGEGTIVDFNGKEYTLTDNQMEYELAAKIVSEQLQKKLGDNSNSTEESKKIDQFVESLNELNSNTMEAVSNAFANWDGEGTPLDIDWAAISPEEYNKIIDQYTEFGGDAGNAYAQALIDSSEQWTLKAYFQRLEEIQTAQIKSQISANELDESAIQLQTELIQKNSEDLGVNTQLLKENENAAMQLAVNNARMNEGLSTLVDKWEDWSAVLESTDKTTIEYAETLGELQVMFSDLLGLTDQMSKNLSAEFLGSAETIELLKKAAEGSTEAITQLGFAAAKDLTKSFKASEGWLSQRSSEAVEAAQEAEKMYGSGEELSEEAIDQIVKNSIDASEKELAAKQIQLTSFIDEISNAIANKDFNLASVDMTGFANSLNQMAQMTGMTVEEMQSMLNSMGLEANIKTETVNIQSSVPVYRTQIKSVSGEANTEGSYIDSYTYQVDSQPVEEKRTVAAIAFNDDKPMINYIGHGNVNAGTKSSISSSKSKKPNIKETVSSSDRYRKYDDQLDDIEESMKDINRQLDLAYGKGRIAQINKMIDVLEKQKDVLEEQAQAAANWKVTDQNDLLKQLAAHGGKWGVSAAGTLNIDENGNMTNYYDYFRELDRIRNEHANKGTLSEEELEALDKWIDETKKAADQYADSVEKYEDTIQQLKDLIVEQMQARFDAWNDALDLEVEISEASIESLSRAMERLQDDFFSRAEALDLFANSNIVGNFSSMASTLESGAAELNSQYYDQKDEYGNPLISQAMYVEGMQKVQEQAEANADAIIDWIATLKEYYADTIEQSLDLFNAEMDHLAHLNDVVEHYKNITEITQGTIDYDMTMRILESQKKNILAQLESAKAAQDMYKEQMETQKAQMEEALAKYGEDSIQYEHAKAEYDAALAALEEIESMTLEKAAEYAQLLRDIFTTQLEQFQKDLEYALGNGKSFDEINKQLEHARSLSEEWLTTTNKIYETNKLMNTAQAALDKTNNVAAKNRLAAFIKETQELQDQGQLSKFQMELQQKKYDLLLAEIALEEAQNAKSVVRLQRDSEGNFGYVYTADQDAIAKAEQDYADKENDLYNFRLEGANDYAEKRLKLDQQLKDDLAELDDLFYNQGIINEEEYNRRKDEILKNYYALITVYAQNYELAMGDSGDRIEGAWSEDFKHMITDTDTWRSSVQDYLGKVEDAWGDFQSEVDRLNGLIYDSNGTVIDSEEALRQKLDEVDKKTAEYASTIKDKLLPELDNELKAVEALTSYIQDTMLGELQKLIEKYEKLATTAAEAWKQAAGSTGAELQVPGYQGTNLGDDNPGGKPCSKCGQNPCACGGSTGTPEFYTGNKSGNLFPTAEGAAENGFFKFGEPVTTPVFQTNDKGDSGTKIGVIGDFLKLQLYQTKTLDKGSSQTVTMAALSSAHTASAIHNGEGTMPTAYWLSWGGGSGYISVADYHKYRLYKTHPTNDDTFKPIAMDSGGYTGTWGPEGRMAMLHQKELVLNAHDTENMLAAVNIVRDLMGSVNLTVASLSSGLVTPDVMPKDGWGFEQSVHIDASFPAVQDRYEIEEAFNNLINTASQFANRKRL